MTISDFNSLQSAIADLCNRTDLTAVIPQFIQEAEVEIGQDVRRTEALAQYTINDVTWPIPSTIKELRSIRLVSGSPAFDLALKNMTPEELAEQRALQLNTAGRPLNFSVIGPNVMFDVTPDQSYTIEVSFIEALSPLSDANPTNTVLSDAPTIYLYGAMVHAAVYLQYDAPVVQTYQALYDRLVQKYNLLREREKYGASLKIGRLPMVFG